MMLVDNGRFTSVVMATTLLLCPRRLQNATLELSWSPNGYAKKHQYYIFSALSQHFLHLCYLHWFWLDSKGL